jgi:hypothetical protein
MTWSTTKGMKLPEASVASLQFVVEPAPQKPVVTQSRPGKFVQAIESARRISRPPPLRSLG